MKRLILFCFIILFGTSVFAQNVGSTPEQI
jgi:hypothetical protein